MKNRQHQEDLERTKQRLQDLRADEHVMPNDSRARCRDGFDMTIADLVSIGKGEIDGASAAARIRAIDSLAKFGYGKATVYVSNERYLRIMGRVTAKYIPDRATFANWIADIKHALEKE